VSEPGRGPDTAIRTEILRAREIAPSILSADFSRLGAEVQEVLDAGARVIHVDVMDGHFVPPITFGPPAVQAIADRVRAAGAIVDVHLMIERPERLIGDFAAAGADNITVHLEATPHVNYAVQQVREHGCSAGVAICPATPAEAVRELAEQGIELVLCMSVNPGWGNQELIPASYGKLARLRAALADGIALEVDGGVHEQTAAPCAQAGANLLVSGSGVFGADDPGAAFRRLSELL
jgi:ribulose-phosphate 3-epimerase